MAIAENALIEFFGTPDVVDGTTPGAVASDGFSIIDAATGLIAWTNDDDAPSATFVLTFDLAVTGTEGSVINLYTKLVDIDGSTGDTEDPSAENLTAYLGSFLYDDNATTSSMIATCIAKLPNMMTQQVHHFFIENKTGQQIDAGWSLRVTPLTYGPHPAA